VKLVIVGAGSSYTPELVQGMLDHHAALPFDSLGLMDINSERLEILAGLAQRIIRRSGLPIEVTATTDLPAALDGAAFVNCLVRVGGMDARINDERIPPKYGVIGQETTGPGGMMKALRTIPVVLNLVVEMQRRCPDALLINYTNPSGIIAEALGKHGGVRFVGLCSGPAGWSRAIFKRMGVDPARGNVAWAGLNHLGFATRVYVDGRDMTAEAIDAVAAHWSVDGEVMRAIGAIPASYLRYYYHHDRVLAEMLEPDYRTRGEQVRKIEAELLRQYADPNLAEKPALLESRGGGGYADVAFAAMHAVHHNTGDRQIVQMLNRGAIDGIPDDASVEVACAVDRLGPHPLRFGALPLSLRGLVQAVKAYESLTVQAAMEGSERIALQALLAHPLVPSYSVAKALLAELLAANRRWLP
jgi:6-phospho-beta-glucosidase